MSRPFASPRIKCLKSPPTQAAKTIRRCPLCRQKLRRLSTLDGGASPDSSCVPSQAILPSPIFPCETQPHHRHTPQVRGTLTGNLRFLTFASSPTQGGSSATLTGPTTRQKPTLDSSRKLPLCTTSSSSTFRRTTRLHGPMHIKRHIGFVMPFWMFRDQPDQRTVPGWIPSQVITAAGSVPTSGRRLNTTAASVTSVR